MLLPQLELFRYPFHKPHPAALSHDVTQTTFYSYMSCVSTDTGQQQHLHTWLLLEHLPPQQRARGQP